MSAPLDSARAVREGEELPLAKLAAYLQSALDLPDGTSVSALQYPSGHSNLTYALSVGERELVLRRPPFGNRVKTAHDMGREHRVLSALHPHFPKAPKPVLLCEDEAVLGAPFYVMERIPGVILRRKLPDGLTLDAAALSSLADAFIATLAELHLLPIESTGLAALGKPEGYIARQVSGWAKRYEDAKTDAIDEMDAVAAWLAQHQPADGPPAMIHNDFKYDNLVLAPDDLGHVIGVLDWEMATVGDPLMDLGTALAYWVEPTDAAPLQGFTFGPTNLPGSPTRAELVARYRRARPGQVPDDLSFYYAFALFKNAVVAQQIYARYQRGLTKDPRFAAFIFGVRMLSQAALTTIEKREF